MKPQKNNRPVLAVSNRARALMKAATAINTTEFRNDVGKENSSESPVPSGASTPEPWFNETVLQATENVATKRKVRDTLTVRDVRRKLDLSLGCNIRTSVLSPKKNTAGSGLSKATVQRWVTSASPSARSGSSASHTGSLIRAPETPPPDLTSASPKSLTGDWDFGRVKAQLLRAPLSPVLTAPVAPSARDNGPPVTGQSTAPEISRLDLTSVSPKALGKTNGAKLSKKICGSPWKVSALPSALTVGGPHTGSAEILNISPPELTSASPKAMAQTNDVTSPIKKIHQSPWKVSALPSAHTDNGASSTETGNILPPNLTSASPKTLSSHAQSKHTTPSRKICASPRGVSVSPAAQTPLSTSGSAAHQPGVALSNDRNTLSNDNGDKEDPLSLLIQSGLISIVPTEQPDSLHDDDSALALAACDGSSSPVKQRAADLLIRSVTEKEQAEEQQRHRLTSSQESEQVFFDSDVEDEQLEESVPEEGETSVLDDSHNTEQTGMRTPTDRPTKRICFPKPSKRKRIRDPSKWMDNIRKNAKNAGLEYTSKRGKVVNSVRMKNPCACSKKCFSKISEEDREKIFASYYSTKSQHSKWDFITRHSESSIVRKRTTEKETSRRNSSRKYFFFTGENKADKVYVCKTMFVNTLAISHGIIDSAYKHLHGGTTKLVSPDKRGVHSNRPKRTSEGQKETIRRHINLYPRVPAHYSRARSQREYLEWGLSMTRMSKQYLEWCASNNIPKENIASRRQYITLLCTEFNISFFKPKKDQCSLCRLIKTGTRIERERYKEKYLKHQTNKKLARKELRAAKEEGVNDRSVKVFAFDLQKVLPLPKSEVSVFFYMSKLSFYNLSCFDLVEQKGTCHLWHEGVAKRGANEIGSCVLQYVGEAAAKGYKTVLSFSDSCGGQNKNRFFFAMMLFASAKYNIVFQHTFLEPGHTQNENDSIHARIESEAKLKELFDIDEWIELIESAKQEEPMYEVKLLKRTDIFDFHKLVEEHQQWARDTNGKKIAWSKVKILRADPSEVGVLFFKYSYDGEEMAMNTKKSVPGRPFKLKSHKLLPAYPGKLPIPQMKINHLSKLCRELAIPSKYHDFYESVFSNAEPAGQDDIGENEENSSDDEIYEVEMLRDREQAEEQAEGDIEDGEGGGEEEAEGEDEFLD